MALLHRVYQPNQIMQVPERPAVLDPAEIDLARKAHALLKEMFEAHGRCL